MASNKITTLQYKRPVYKDALEEHARILEERAAGHVLQLRRSHTPKPKKRKAKTFITKHVQTTDSKQKQENNY